VEAHRATHAWLPNFAFLHLARTVGHSRSYDLSSLTALISCSEPCKVEAFDAFLASFADWGVSPTQLQTCYAMAETVFAVSQTPAGTEPRRRKVPRAMLDRPDSGGNEAKDGRTTTLLSNGPPIAGVQVAILRDGRLCNSATDGSIGEICLRAPFMFSGYNLNVEATDSAFIDGWYRTGDIGFMEAGEIFITGRLKDLIIVNGQNVFAHDVESAASRVKGIKPGRVVAFGLYDAEGGSEQIIVLAERDPANPADPEQMVARINRAVIDEAGVPCQDVRVTEPGWLIKTTSGKISRVENKRKYIDAIHRESEADETEHHA
jgi:acyl-CoA synthetase (AMP-forming)/AMP-acid ligase II